MLLAALVLYESTLMFNALSRERIIEENGTMTEELASRYKFERAPYRDFRVQVGDPSEDDAGLAHPFYAPTAWYRYYLLTSQFINYRENMMRFELRNPELIKDNVAVPAFMRRDE